MQAFDDFILPEESLMGKYFLSNPFHSLRKAACSILAFIWLLGLILGMILAFSEKDSFYSLMHGVIYHSVSIVWLICTSILPFLLSTIVVYLSSPALLLFVCFCKAFLLGFTAAAIMLSFGSAGWLIKYFLLFSDFASVPVLYLFWMYTLTRNRLPQASVLLGAGAYFLLVGGIHVCVISPYFASLIIN